MQNVSIRPASLSDLPSLTEIHNYYAINTHITFDVQPFDPEQRKPWFNDHSDGHRYQLLVADDPQGGVLGYACTGRFRAKEAYDTTVEASVACRPDATGRGLGKLLYEALFEAIADQISTGSSLASRNRILAPTPYISASVLGPSGLLAKWDANLINTGTSSG